MREKFKNVFYGWWMVAAGIVLVMFGYGTWQYSFGNFFGPISAEFGWSRAKISLAFSFARVEGGIEGLITGPLIDKFGPRFMVRVGWTMMAIGFLMLHYVNSYWMYILAYTVFLSLGANAGLYMSLQTAIAKWFHRKRGMALGALTTGGALGGSILVPLTAWLITSYGWRTAVIPLAIASLVLGWVFGSILKPHTPDRYGLNVDGYKIEPIKEGGSSTVNSHAGEKGVGIGEGFTLKQAMKTANFWLIVFVSFVSSTIMNSIQVHQIPFLEDMGVSKILAAAALGALTLMSTPGRLTAGWLADRWKAKNVYCIACVLMAVALIIFTQIKSMSLVWVFVSIYGLGFGLRMPVEPALRADCFGAKSFGTIYGYMNAFTSIGSFIGPLFAGWIYDTTKSYMIAFTVFAAMMIIASVVVLFVKPPKQLHKPT